MKKILIGILALFMITGCDLFNKSDDKTSDTKTSGSQTTSQTGSQSGNNTGSTTTSQTVDYKAYAKAGGEYVKTIEKSMSLTNGEHKLAFIYSKYNCPGKEYDCYEAYVTIFMDNIMLVHDELIFTGEGKEDLDNFFADENSYIQNSNIVFLPNTNGTFVIKLESVSSFSRNTNLFIVSNKGDVLLKKSADGATSIGVTQNGVYTALMSGNYTIKDNMVIVAVFDCNLIDSGQIEAYTVSNDGKITSALYSFEQYFGAKVELAGAVC